MPRFSECWRCGNTGVSVVCRGCEVAKYCSNACLRNDKPRHDAECKPVAIVKTCSSCKKSGPRLRTCARCYRAFYCDINCQKSHWKRHKSECDSTKEKVMTLSHRMLQRYAPQVYTVIPKLYYWGNSPAFDSVNLQENEGADYGLDLNVLYLGVGDLRNVVLTCASLPATYEHEVMFVLNDRETCVLARLVLFLFMLIKGGDGVEKMVTEIWYSMLLSEPTYKYLCASLRALINSPRAEDLKTATVGLITIDGDHLKELKNVWIRWHNLQVKGTTWIQKQREQEFMSSAASSYGRETYFNCIPREHVKSAKKWMENGVFDLNQKPAFAENPTLTGFIPLVRDNSYFYCIPSDVLPFTGWDYLDVKKFKHANSLVSMYGGYIEHLLRAVMKRMSNKKLCFQILLCDCKEVERSIGKDTTFDRILTTNLMDYILLPNLLRACSLKLNHSNPFATIVTETHNWTRDFCPNGDVSGSFNLFTFFLLEKTALEDTKNPEQAHDGGTGCREYLENSDEFLDYLRALFYTHSTAQNYQDGRAPSKPMKLPIYKELAKEFQLRLRDGFRNENRLVAFKMAVNRRRVTMITGLERCLEWVPLKKE